MPKLWIAAVLLACAAQAQSQAEAQTPVLPPKAGRAIMPGALDGVVFSQAVLVFVNRERGRAGLAPLSDDKGLRRLAARQAEDMAQAQQMTHRLPGAKPGRLAQRLEAAGVSFRRAGENIAMDKAYQLVGRPISTRAQGCAFTYADDGAPVPPHSHATLAQSVVARWMASPGHRANILAPGFRRMGAGAALDPRGAACGDVYLAQAFAD